MFCVTLCRFWTSQTRHFSPFYVSYPKGKRGTDAAHSQAPSGVDLTLTLLIFEFTVEKNTRGEHTWITLALKGLTGWYSSTHLNWAPWQVERQQIALHLALPSFLSPLLSLSLPPLLSPLSFNYPFALHLSFCLSLSLSLFPFLWFNSLVPFSLFSYFLSSLFHRYRSSIPTPLSFSYPPLSLISSCSFSLSILFPLLFFSTLQPSHLTSVIFFSTSPPPLLLHPSFLLFFSISLFPSSILPFLTPLISLLFLPSIPSLPPPLPLYPSFSLFLTLTS